MVKRKTKKKIALVGAGAAVGAVGIGSGLLAIRKYKKMNKGRSMKQMRKQKRIGIRETLTKNNKQVRVRNAAKEVKRIKKGKAIHKSLVKQITPEVISEQKKKLYKDSKRQPKEYEQMTTLKKMKAKQRELYEGKRQAKRYRIAKKYGITIDDLPRAAREAKKFVKEFETADGLSKNAKAFIEKEREFVEREGPKLGSPNIMSLTRGL